MLSQKQIEYLQKVYLASRDILLDKIINTGGAGTKTYYNTVLKQLNQEIERLQQTTNTFIDTTIPEEYQKGLNEVYDYFKRNNLMMKQPDIFANIHTDAIHGLTHEMQYQISQGIAQSGRQVLRYLDTSRDEALRRIGLESSAEKAASGSTVIDMKNRMISKLQNEGFMTVQYGEGSRAYQVSLDSYAAMVARSTTREAGNIARENQLTENGYDLVEISKHYPTCTICARYEGRVFSISGNDKRFPPLSHAFASGYHNIHPNCRHVVVPWIETLQKPEEVQEAIEVSSKPFEDNRDQNQIDLYNKIQGQNRQMRQDLYQYERYKTRLGVDAPQSFHSFRKVKKANDEMWKFMNLDYSRRNRLLNQPELALPYADTATAAEAKFVKYLFNPENKSGYAKGLAFNSRLGYNIGNWQELQKEIVDRAPLYPAQFIQTDIYGSKHEQKIIIYGKKGTPANVIIGWQSEGSKTWMSSCYIKEVD